MCWRNYIKGINFHPSKHATSDFTKSILLLFDKVLYSVSFTGLSSIITSISMGFPKSSHRYELCMKHYFKMSKFIYKLDNLQLTSFLHAFWQWCHLSLILNANARSVPSEMIRSASSSDTPSILTVASVCCKKQN